MYSIYRDLMIPNFRSNNDKINDHSNIQKSRDSIIMNKMKKSNMRMFPMPTQNAFEYIDFYRNIMKNINTLCILYVNKNSNGKMINCMVITEDDVKTFQDMDSAYKYIANDSSKSYTMFTVKVPNDTI